MKIKAKLTHYKRSKDVIVVTLTRGVRKEIGFMEDICRIILYFRIALWNLLDTT